MTRFGLALACLALTACAVSSPFQRGVAAYREGRYTVAVAAFDQAIRSDPNSPPAFSNRGAARVRLGEIAGALADYDRAIQLAPGDSELYFNRGNASVAAGEPERAVSDFTRAIELDGLNAKAYYNRGTARMLAGDPRGREDRLKALEVEIDPWMKADMRRRLGLALPHADGSAARAPEPNGPPASTGPPAATSPAPPPAPAPAVKSPPKEVVAVPPSAETLSVADTQPEARPGRTAVNLDAKALAVRGLARELDGDHVGAVADLRAALALERDEGRRAGLRNLLQLLTEPPR